MKLIFLSVKLFVFGAFCDFFAKLCTHITEKNLQKNKPLNKKLLTYMSNFSNNCFIRWQIIERKFIRFSLDPAHSLPQQPR